MQEEWQATQARWSEANPAGHRSMHYPW
jgi:hypothetical protein